VYKLKKALYKLK
jgi:hypothetical protein